MPIFLALFMVMLCGAGLLPPPGVSTTSLQLSPSASATLGQTVTLTASITPSDATGKVAFYDGVTVLGTAPVSAAQAVFSTSLLASGIHSLTARYTGDGNYSPSLSLPAGLVVASLPQFEFMNPVSLSLGSQPYAVAVGDFNSDGKPDFAVGDWNDQNITVYLGNGDGTFTKTATNYPAGGRVQFLVVADFNRDGIPDLAVATANNGALVLLGNGDGSFQTPTQVSTVTSLGIAVTDFNGDGFADLAIPNQSGSGVTILLGKGDGTFLSATAASSDSFPFYVTAGDFNGDGKPDLAVTFNGGNGNLLLGNGDGTFQPPLNFYGLHGPAVVADFNGDGKADIAGIDGSSVGVLLGNGNGTFQAPVNIAGVNAAALAVGDFNGDGKLDLVVQDQVNFGFWTVAGVGDGTFQAPAGSPAVLNGRAIAVADFNHDGRSDMVILSASGSNALVFLGSYADLTISVSHSGNIVQGETGAAYSIVVANVGNGSVTTRATVTAQLTSGLTATAISGGGWSCTLATLSCTRTNVLLSGASYPVITLTLSVASNATSETVLATVVSTSDTNPANNIATDPTTVIPAPDLAVDVTTAGHFSAAGPNVSTTTVQNVGTAATSTLTTVSMFYGAGQTPVSLTGLGWSCTLATLSCTRSDALSPGASWPAISFSVSLDDAIGDTAGVQAAVANNLDGNASNNSKFISIPVDRLTSSLTLTSDAVSATLGKPLALTATVTPNSRTGRVAFYDGATIIGYATLVNGHASITTSLLPAGTRPLGAFYLGGATSKPSSATHTQAVYVITEAPLLPRVNYTSPGAGVGLAVADFNGDGKPDLATASYTGGQFVSVMLGNGDGTFGAPVNSPSCGPALTLLAGDFNEDGKQDLVAICSGSSVKLLLGNGDGTFQTPTTINVLGVPTSGVVGDFYADGHADIVFTNSNYSGVPYVSLVPGKGDGSFYTSSVSSAPYGTTEIVAADFNGDGKLDVATVATFTTTGGVAVLLGNGDGSFQSPQTYAPNTQAAYLAVGDLNGDGKPDLVVSTIQGPSVLVLLGNGDGTFQAPKTFAAAQAGRLVVADINGDGRADVITAAGAIYLGPGDGTLASPTAIPSVFGYDLAAGEFNGDGRTDLAFSNSFNFTQVALGSRYSYLVGDVYPFPANNAPNFGDTSVDTLDLINLLRAVVKIPGYAPNGCTDRFDAMDVFPVDADGVRGGDGSLDTRDLVALLKRVTNVDPSRPMRSSRSGDPCVFSGTASQAMSRAMSRVTPSRPEASLEVSADGWVTLRATADLSLSGLSFSLGGGENRLRFEAASSPPSLIDNDVPGTLAAAWLDGLTLKSGDRLVLGRVTAGGASARALRFFGVSANAAVTGRPVSISLR